MNTVAERTINNHTVNLSIAGSASIADMNELMLWTLALENKLRREAETEKASERMTFRDLGCTKDGFVIIAHAFGEDNAGDVVQLAPNLYEVRLRYWDLSFDPYPVYHDRTRAIETLKHAAGLYPNW